MRLHLIYEYSYIIDEGEIMCANGVAANYYIFISRRKTTTARGSIPRVCIFDAVCTCD
jgi:hypothetical protein